MARRRDLLVDKKIGSVIRMQRVKLGMGQTEQATLLPHLKRVVLVTGTKYYGVHLGPLKTPMRETDPRHIPPNYYFNQIDWLTAYGRGKEWDWVELRPQTLCGFSTGSPMSILPAIAVYAAVSRGGGPFAIVGTKSSVCRCAFRANLVPTTRSIR